MIAIVLCVLTSLLTTVIGTCQSVDGQRVSWWILYQQKDRPFFHQYVDSTNSHKIKEHYPEKVDSVLSRVILSVLNQNEAEYIIYSSDLINVKDIAAKTSIPTYSKWMHGILGTTSSWNSGFWILHNNLLFPALQNTVLAVPGSKAWYATTVGDSSADLFYICLTAENKGNITEMLISIMAGNPFIYKKKLQKYDFLQPYFKEVRSLQTSFGYEMSASIFLDCMYKSTTNDSTNCLFTYAVTTGNEISVFTRSRGMVKHSSAFCYDDQSNSLFDFLREDKRSTLKSGFSNSMFVLSDTTGITCFGQDVAANAETVAVMICATLPNIHGSIIKSARLTKWSCRADSTNKHSNRKSKINTDALHFPVIKQTTASKPSMGNNEGENESGPLSNAADDNDKKNIAKLCQMYDCGINNDNLLKPELSDSQPLKNPLMKYRKLADWFNDMVAEIEMQHYIQHPQKAKKIFEKEKTAIKVKGALEVSHVLLKNKKPVLALFCREGCKFCQNAREQFILLSKSIQTDYLDFCIVDILEPSLPDFLQVPFTPYVRYKFSGLSQWIDYSGEAYDIKDILIFLHKVTTVKRYCDDGCALTNASKVLYTTISNNDISERKRRETREIFRDRDTLHALSRTKRAISQGFRDKHIWEHNNPRLVTRDEVRTKLDELNTALNKDKKKIYIRKTNTFIVTMDRTETENRLIGKTDERYAMIPQNEKDNNPNKICVNKKKYPSYTFDGIEITEIDAILVHATYIKVNGEEQFRCGIFTNMAISVSVYIDNNIVFVNHFGTQPVINEETIQCEQGNN